MHTSKLRHKCSYESKGFTLAEVLVTLVIIGIVAALTIPTLMQNIQKSQHKTAFKKFFSEFSQAHKLICLDYDGSIKNKNGTVNLAEFYFNNVRRYMSVVKQCGWAGGGNPTTTGVCWHNNGVAKYMDGTDFPDTTTSPTLILSNGTFIIYNTSNSACNLYSVNANICMGLYVDVNGFKGPNIVGKDIFYVAVEDRIISPFGRSGIDGLPCTAGSVGTGCAFKVLTGQDY